MFRWFEEAFEGLRSELHTLIASMTRQQAMVAELIDSRQAELRLALVAESLPEIVADAVHSAMTEQAHSIASTVEHNNERGREHADEALTATNEAIGSLERSFRSMVDAMAIHDEEAEQREADRVEGLSEALADISERVDALADRVSSPSRSRGSAWVPPPTATLISTDRMKRSGQRQPAIASGRRPTVTNGSSHTPAQASPHGVEESPVGSTAAVDLPDEDDSDWAPPPWTLGVEESDEGERPTQAGARRSGTSGTGSVRTR